MIIYDDIISFDYYILAHIITVIIIKKIALTSAISVKKYQNFYAVNQADSSWSYQDLDQNKIRLLPPNYLHQ